MEQAKINLAQRADFNLFDAFKIFDTHSAGYIFLGELKQGLADIGLHGVTYNELELYFKRYDRDHDGKLRFSEFCESMLPLDSYYASMLNRRSSNNVRAVPPHYARDECFTSYSTRLDFKELWRTHLRVEQATEEQRQNLSSKPLFSAYEAFKTCDVNDNGIVSTHEIKKLLETRGFYVPHRQVSNLVDKFDKNRDGKISYSEFMEEILPKSPVRRHY